MTTRPDIKDRASPASMPERVSRQARRASARAEHFAHLRSTGMGRKDARFLTACKMHNRAVCRALDREAASREAERAASREAERAALRARCAVRLDPRTAPFGTLPGDAPALRRKNKS